MQTPSSDELRERVIDLIKAQDAGAADAEPLLELAHEAYNAARDLERALKAVHEKAYWVKRAADEALAATTASDLNELGILQGSGPALDVAVAVFMHAKSQAASAYARFEKAASK